MLDTHPAADPATPLRIAVVGLGGIGSAFAFHLSRTGHHEVTAVARPDSLRLRQLRRDEGIVDRKGERASVSMTDVLDEGIPYDLVVVTLLAHQVDAVLPALCQSAAKRILFMFNNFEPERLRDAVGAERCAFGMPFIQARLDGDGRLDATIGAGGQKTRIGDRGGVDLFVAAGLPSVFEPDMPLWLRCHAPLCVAFESVSAAGVRRGGGASWREAVVLARGVRESFTLIQRLGFRLYPSGKSLLNRSPAWVVAGMLWSMSRVPSFRELLATGTGECRALVGTMVRAASKVSPPVRVARIEAMKPPQP